MNIDFTQFYEVRNSLSTTQENEMTFIVHYK